MIFTPIDLIEDYTFSRNTSERYRSFDLVFDQYYGLEVYEKLQHYYTKELEQPGFSDLRPLHLLWEHKKCMLLRIEYFKNQKYIQNDNYRTGYKEIEKLSLISRNMLVKYKISENKKIKVKLIDLIGQIAEKEKKILIEMIEDLKTNNF